MKPELRTLVALCGLCVGSKDDRSSKTPVCCDYQMAVAALFSPFTHLAEKKLPVTTDPQEMLSTVCLPSLPLPKLSLPSSARASEDCFKKGK